MEAETTILDDPFSSLDQQTAVLIRIRLFTDGFATEGGKTLVMTTSTSEFQPCYNGASDLGF